MVHFKRFEANGRFSDKIDTFVDFPMKSLDLTNYMPPPLPPGADKSQLNGGLPLSLEDPRSQLPPYRYDLYGVTNHYGNLSSGHCEFLGLFLSYLWLTILNVQIPRSLRHEVAGCIAMTAVSNPLIPNKLSCVTLLPLFSPCFFSNAKKIFRAKRHTSCSTKEFDLRFVQIYFLDPCLWLLIICIFYSLHCLRWIAEYVVYS